MLMQKNTVNPTFLVLIDVCVTWAVKNPHSLIYFVYLFLQRQIWSGCSGSGDYVELLGGNGVDTSKMFPVADLCFSLSGLGKTASPSIYRLLNRTISDHITTIMAVHYALIFIRSLLFVLSQNRTITFGLPVFVPLSYNTIRLAVNNAFKLPDYASNESCKIITSHMTEAQIFAMLIRHFLPFCITKAQIYSPLCRTTNPK